MTDTEKQPQDVLREEIISDAQRQAKRTLQRARKEAAAIIETAEAELDAWRTAQMEQARTEAEHRRERIMASLPVETGRMRSDRIESLLQSVYDDACQQLENREGLDVRQMIIHLSAEAISSMTGSHFSITLSPIDLALLDEAGIAEIRERSERPDLELDIVAGPENKDVGPIISGSDGGELYDNRLPQRLERNWPALRREIALRTGLVETVESSKGVTL